MTNDELALIIDEISDQVLKISDAATSVDPELNSVILFDSLTGTGNQDRLNIVTSFYAPKNGLYRCALTNSSATSATTYIAKLNAQATHTTGAIIDYSQQLHNQFIDGNRQIDILAFSEISYEDLGDIIMTLPNSGREDLYLFDFYCQRGEIVTLVGKTNSSSSDSFNLKIYCQG